MLFLVCPWLSGFAQTYHVRPPQYGPSHITIQDGHGSLEIDYCPNVFGSSGFVTVDMQPDKVYLITIYHNKESLNIQFKTFGLPEDYVYRHYLCWDCDIYFDDPDSPLSYP